MESTSTLELVVYKRQFSQHGIGALLALLSLPVTITTIETEPEMGQLKKRISEIASKNSSICCFKETQMLPCLVDSANNQVVCGPEAITVYIILSLAKKPEMLRCTSDVQEVQMLEIRSMMIQWCYGMMHQTSIDSTKMKELVKVGVEKNLQRIEDILSSDSRNTVMRTKDWTLADLMVFDFVQFFEKVSAGSTSGLSKCNALVARIKQVPEVQKFISSPEYMKGVDSFTPDVCMYVWGLDVPSAK